MFQFTQPLYLLLAIPAVYFILRLSKQSLADMSKFRFKLSVALRVFIILLLILALAGARMVRNISQQCVVFVMDVSDSIPKSKQDTALAYINRTLKTMKGEQKVGLIVFGGDASVELAPCSANKINKIYSVPNTSQTDISQALGLALAIFPQDCAKKIVLLSDGNETIGKSIDQAKLAGSDNVSIDVVPIANELPKEALLDKMIAPDNVRIGEPFDLKVIAFSKISTTGLIRIIRNGVPVSAKAVELPKGKNIFTFSQSIPRAGSYEYSAILECSDDTCSENNIALSHTMVKGKPKILYIEGQADQSMYLAGALKSNDVEVDVRASSGMPATLAQLREYDMLVLSDVPAWNLSSEQMALIRSGVKDLGIGFTMIGGENGFGAGGYYDTPVEQALPVDMSIRKTKVLPSIAVVIVMDKSGSMGASEGSKTKIQLANDAAAAVVKLLQPIDKVGVIVCHSYPVVAVDLRPAMNKDPIYNEIATIRAEGGGIAVYPSMQEAYKMISGSGTRQKHIILLADGSDCDDQQGVIPLAETMAREKITVTTVAIGDGPHVPFLKAVAYEGKGYYYLARQAQDLKAIFTKDIMTISKSLVIEEPFTPRLDTSSPELTGIDASSIPPLMGYVATSAKPAARVLMQSHRKDPILAAWQFGLGKSAAFTSDCKARWSSRWVGWPNYNKFWAQVLRSTMRKGASTNFQTTVDVSNGVGKVVIDSVDDKGKFMNMLKFKGSVVGPDMNGHPIAIEQTGPGRYEAAFDARDVGNYVLSVVRKDQGQTAPEVSVVSIPYPPEYKEVAPNTENLRMLALQTSGMFAPDASTIFSSGFRPTLAYRDLWYLLTLLAVLILPVDVAVRRVAVSPELLYELYHYISNRFRSILSKSKRTPKQENTETVSVLLNARRERAESEQSQPPICIKPSSIASNQVSADTKHNETPEPPTQPAQESEVDVTSRLLQAKKRAQGDKK